MLSLGDTLHNRYRIDRLLEIGALEASYVGWDLVDSAAVTIVELMPQPNLDQASLDTLRETFERQARALSQLDHPGIIAVLDYFSESAPSASGDGIQVNAYLVRAATPGQTLAEVLGQEGTVAEERAVAWGIQVLEALDYAHGQGIRHRDIKPDNIVISPDGRASLTNFEILALWNPSDPRTWTAKRVMGTPDYAPPERWGTRQTKIDPRSDIYSLGACLYHALTGEQPITAGERTSNPYQFLQVKALNPRVSDQTKAVILRAMSLPPDKRYQSATQMALALRQVGHRGAGQPQAPPPAIMLASHRYKSPKTVGVTGWIGSALAIIVAAIAGLWLGPVWGGGEPTAPVTAVPTMADETTLVPPTQGVTAIEHAPGTAAGETESTPAGSTEAPNTASAAALPDAGRATATPDPFGIFASLAPTPPPGWQLLAQDTFDDNVNQWLVSEYEDDWGSITRRLVSGTYRWVIDADQAVGRWCTPELRGQGAEVDSFYVSVDARRESGPEAAAYGLILRLNEGDYYQFSVRDDGYYQFSLWYGYEWLPVIDWTTTTLVAAGETNRLTVVAQGNQFQFYINDEFADKAEGEQLIAGEVGLSVSTAATDGDAVFIFDNYELWRPQGW